jgi:hypothetical protein
MSQQLKTMPGLRRSYPANAIAPAATSNAVTLAELKLIAPYYEQDNESSGTGG